MSLLVLFNISAAFDTIDHGILGEALAWLRSFLEDHPQRVQLRESVSAPWSLNCGVPQGSIISPMLFNIYMRPLGGVIGGVEPCVISTLMTRCPTPPDNPAQRPHIDVKHHWGDDRPLQNPTIETPQGQNTLPKLNLSLIHI